MDKLDVFRKIAAVRGGECLATEYVNGSTKLKFCCKDGHQFEARASHVKSSGSWCPVCAKNTSGMLKRFPNALENMKLVAVEKGGKCLATEYAGNSIKMPFECMEGHVFYASRSKVKNGQWCPVCSGRELINPLGDMQEIAAVRGGECLATEYINTTNKYKFECMDGHNFMISYSCLKYMNQWCPACTNKSENLVRLFFETVFEDSLFPNCSPAWLKCEDRKYILDGYNEKLKLAFEYHGIQHYETVAHFHRLDTKKLIHQKQRDEFVRNKCMEYGVTLIEIQTFPVNYNQIQFIRHLENSLKIACGFSARPALINKFKQLPFSTSNLSKWNSVAELRGGKCLSVKFLGTKAKLTWECAFGHQWDAKPDNIRNGKWCPVCSGRKLIEPLLNMQKIAVERGGECLATVYVGTKTKMPFRCDKGHEWDAKPDNIKTGSWCPVCAGKKSRKIE